MTRIVILLPHTTRNQDFASRPFGYALLTSRVTSSDAATTAQVKVFAEDPDLGGGAK
jgi:hypothetical protein